MSNSKEVVVEGDTLFSEVDGLPLGYFEYSEGSTGWEFIPCFRGLDVDVVRVILDTLEGLNRDKGVA